jgi:hypothetical protein
MKTLTFIAPDKVNFVMQQPYAAGPVMWIVSAEDNKKLFRFRAKTIRNKDKTFKHMKYYVEEV